MLAWLGAGSQAISAVRGDWSTAENDESALDSAAGRLKLSSAGLPAIKASTRAWRAGVYPVGSMKNGVVGLASDAVQFREF